MPAIAVNYFRSCKFELFYKCTSTTNVENPTNVGNLAMVQSFYICRLGPVQEPIHQPRGQRIQSSCSDPTAAWILRLFSSPWPMAQRLNILVQVETGRSSTLAFATFILAKIIQRTQMTQSIVHRTSMHFSQYSLNFGSC